MHGFLHLVARLLASTTSRALLIKRGGLSTHPSSHIPIQMRTYTHTQASEVARKLLSLLDKQPYWQASLKEILQTKFYCCDIEFEIAFATERDREFCVEQEKWGSI